MGFSIPAVIAAKVLAISLALAVPGVHAQQIEPRSYSNIPIGVSFLNAGYAYAEGGVATDPSVPLTNADVQTHTALLAYAHSLNIRGRSGKCDVILPYAWTSGTAEFAGQPGQREVAGLGDTLFRCSVNFYGAPALTLKEFADYRQDTIIGASLQVSVPTGQYDADKLLNNGTNRWFVKPELGLSQAWGPWTAELAAGVKFFTDNEDFLGGKTLAQDPIYSMQGHLIYGWRSGIWMSLTGTYFRGGRTTLDGVKGDNLQNNTRLGLTVAMPIDRHNSVKLYASTGVSTRTGGDYDLIGFAWQYRWGGGM